MKTTAQIKKYYSALRPNVLFPALLLVLMFWAETAEAQLTLGARGASMGESVTALPSGSWGVFGNPAMLYGTDNEAAFYGIRNFGLSELTDMAFAAHYHHHNYGSIAAGSHTYGFEKFRESRFRLGYAYEYVGIQAGIALNYTHIQIQDYGSAGTLLFDAGVAYPLPVPGELWIGAKATNISRSRIGEAREELPRELSIGFSYKLSDRGTITGDVVKDVRFPVSYRGGIEVRLVDRLYMRGGLTTEPVTYSVGMGFSHQSFSINLVARQHYALDWSPGLDFSLSW